MNNQHIQKAGLRLAVIGLGRWGPNHIRVFNAIKDCAVIAAADTVATSRDRITSMFPDITCANNYEEILARPDIDAVVVATPTSTHYKIVKAALLAGKHVLCEKPITNASRDAWELAKLAQQKKLQLMVGHVFLFNAGIEYLASAIRQNQVGPLYYLDAVRINLGPFRKDVNAAWDLASHDIYIFNEILQSRPLWVSATGASYLQKDVEDISFLTLQYPNNILGHIHVSWLDPKKVRSITVVGEKKMMTWDEFGSPGPIMIYDRSVVKDTSYNTFGEFQLLTREGDVVVPRISMQEPLALQAKTFFQRCTGHPTAGDARGTATQAAEVVDILSAASQSLKEKGRAVEVAYGD